MSYQHRYKLLYKVKKPPEPPTKEELLKSGTDFSATDALLLVSLIYPPDGSLSTYFMGLDGRKEGPGGVPGVLDDEEWFKVWALLAHRLANSKALSDTQKLLCASVHEAVRAAVLAGRARNEGGVCPHGRAWQACPVCFPGASH